MTETLEWNQIAPLLPDVTGWRVLIVGSSGFAAQLAELGAVVRVMAPEPEPLGSAAPVEFEQKSIYEAASTWETYDFVVCLGVLDGLRYPLLGLDIAAHKARRLLLLETQQLPQSALAEAGLNVLMRPRDGLYLCEPSQNGSKQSAEYAAAVGLVGRLGRSLQFKHCWVNCAPGYTETCYYDGTKVTAAPEDTEKYRKNAVLFGYGTDIEALSREHEILHTFLAEKLGFGSSPTLWAVAHGQGDDVAPIWEQEEEEGWTLAFQTYLQGGPPTEPLSRLSDANLDVAALREEALRLLR